MLIPRVMPCLLLRDGALVKTIKFQNPSYVGDPTNAIRIYNEKEVDELIVLDITATIEEGWHIYSITQPKGGPLASKIALTPATNFSLSGDFAANPKPEVHFADVFPGLPLEEHRKQVTWQAPVRLAEGVNPADMKITGRVTIQACSDIDMNCLPPRPYEFSAAYKQAANDGFREEQSKVILRGRIEPASVT